MSQKAIIYQEQLTDEELEFLSRKAYSTRSNYFKVIRLLYLICFIIMSIVIAVYTFSPESTEPEEMEAEKLSPYFFILTTLVLMILVTLIAVLGYYQNVGKIFKDIKRKNKTIEQTIVSRKKYMPHNNTYHLFLLSVNKLSIEVSEKDYAIYNAGDEINIEYASVSKYFLGYF